MVQAVLDVTAALAVTFAVVTVFAVWRTVRAARRRWSRWRAAMSMGGAPLRSATGAVAAIAAMPASDPQWWLRQRDRHRMWRAVTSAERAVSTARRAGAPVGDLASVTHRLRTTTTGVDALLRAGGRPAEARLHVNDVMIAARDIQSAATEALLAVATPEATGLVDAVQLEVTALRHGLAAARQ